MGLLRGNGHYTLPNFITHSMSLEQPLIVEELHPLIDKSRRIAQMKAIGLQIPTAMGLLYAGKNIYTVCQGQYNLPTLFAICVGSAITYLCAKPCIAGQETLQKINESKDRNHLSVLLFRDLVRKKYERIERALLKEASKEKLLPLGRNFRPLQKHMTELRTDLDQFNPMEEEETFQTLTKQEQREYLHNYIRRVGSTFREAEQALYVLQADKPKL